MSGHPVDEAVAALQAETKRLVSVERAASDDGEWALFEYDNDDPEMP